MGLRNSRPRPAKGGEKGTPMKKRAGYLVKYETMNPAGMTLQHTRTGFKTLLRAFRTAFAIKCNFYSSNIRIYATFLDRPAEVIFRLKR